MTAAVILAAGGSTRFGRQKLREPLRGRPLVRWAVDAAREIFAENVIVVTGADDVGDLLPDGVAIVNNPQWAKGLATSLTVGIEAASEMGHDVVVVGLGDQPFVTASAWKAVSETDSPIAVADFDGDHRPPVRLHRSVWHLLPTEGDDGARRVMASRPDLVVAVPCSGKPDDIDTQEDLARWS